MENALYRAVLVEWIGLLGEVGKILGTGLVRQVAAVCFCCWANIITSQYIFSGFEIS